MSRCFSAKASSTASVAPTQCPIPRTVSRMKRCNKAGSLGCAEQNPESHEASHGCMGQANLSLIARFRYNS